MRQRSMRRPWRLPAAIVAGILAGTILITPASGHLSGVTHTWNQHFRPKADARYERPLYAVVRGSDGALQRGRGVASVVRTATGSYVVTFTRRVDSCAPVVQMGGYPTGLSSFTGFGHGFAAASVLGTGAPYNRDVAVSTRTTAEAPANRTFILTVTC